MHTNMGYVRIMARCHPFANGRRLIFEHVAVAELALGKQLPEGAVVHHINNTKSDNKNANLVVCQDQAYHLLLHARIEARDACGNPSFRKCFYCGSWCDPDELDGGRDGNRHHRRCAAEWQQKRRDRLRGDRPKHLEAVRSSPKCKHGHLWTEETTRFNARGVRWCLACSRIADAKRKHAA